MNNLEGLANARFRTDSTWLILLLLCLNVISQTGTSSSYIIHFGTKT